MRFLKRDALALSQLNRSSVPVLELLGEPGLEPNPARTPPMHILVRQDLVQQALAIRDSMRSGDLTELPIKLRQDVLTAQMDTSHCTIPGATETWLNAVSAIARDTTGLLAPEDLRPMWQKIRTTACFQRIDDAGRLWIEYLEAVAARDRPAIVEFGARLLERPKRLPENLRADVLLAVVASRLGSGNVSGAVAELQNHRNLLAERRTADLRLRLVEANVAARIAATRNIGATHCLSRNVTLLQISVGPVGNCRRDYVQSSGSLRTIPFRSMN
jgi:DNA-binding transcriptional regulator YdaS (Cro superfamily)